MNEPKQLSKLEQPTDLMPSVSGQAADTSHASMSPARSERPLHEYVRAVCERADVRVGVPLPLGTYVRGEGVNFAFFSRHANRVRLELFDHSDETIALVADARDFRLCHGLVPCREGCRESRDDQTARAYGGGLEGG